VIPDSFYNLKDDFKYIELLRQNIINYPLINYPLALKRTLITNTITTITISIINYYENTCKG